MEKPHRTYYLLPITSYFPKNPECNLGKSEEVRGESCIVKKDCSKSENMVKYFQESERDEKANELHKGV